MCKLSPDEVLALVVYSYDVRNLGGTENENFYFQLNEQLRIRVNYFFFFSFFSLFHLLLIFFVGT